MEVNVKSEWPILLPHQHHGIAPWRMGWHCHPAFLECVGILHPPRVGQCARIFPWMTRPSTAPWCVQWCQCTGFHLVPGRRCDGIPIAMPQLSVPGQAAIPWDDPTLILLKGSQGEFLSLQYHQFDGFRRVRISLSSFFRRSGEHRTSGTTLAATTWLITCPLVRCMGQAVRFRSTTVTLHF